jgi:phosphatidylserine decarboxylase
MDDIRHLMSERSQQTVAIYNRKTGSVEAETIFERGLMEFLYGSRIGFALTEGMLKHRFATEVYARRMHSPNSKAKIQEFIDRFGVKIEELERPLDSFQSFNEFFIRKLKPEARPIDREPGRLISVADCRLSVYDITPTGVFPVKARSFTVQDLLGDPDLARAYVGGQCLIFRLAPVDYHRFCFVDDCEASATKAINGFYRSVHPLSLRRLKAVFTENRREYCVLKTAAFDEIIHIDVGATGVGRIVQNAPQGGRFKRGEEKGYFEFGGSTSILLLKPGAALIDDDIRRYSLDGVETLVQYGENIGEKV